MPDAPQRFPPGFAVGVRLFNAGEFFAAHEAFEELLDRVEGDERWECLVALVQIAVGYHKATAGHPGAARMLTLGSTKLASFPAVFRGLALDRLRRTVGEDIAVLETGGTLGQRRPRIEMTRETRTAAT